MPLALGLNCQTSLAWRYETERMAAPLSAKHPNRDVRSDMPSDGHSPFTNTAPSDG